MHHAPSTVPLRFLAVVLLLSPVGAQESTPPQAGQQDAVVATVGSWRIQSADLLAEINRQIPLVSFHRNVSPEKLREIRRQALDDLIERSLIHQDALHRGIPIEEEELRTTLRATLAKVPGAGDAEDEQFEALLRQYRPQLERRILRDKNEARFAAGLPEIGPEALETAYQRLQEVDAESLLTPPEAHLQHIFFAVERSSLSEVWEEQGARAETALGLLADGRPFEEVAREYSEDELAEKGGDMGVVRKADIKSATVREAAFALEEGQLSGVVQSLYGFHILRCQKAVPRRLLRLEEVRPMLEAWWKAEHRKRAREAWLAELRERYPVEIAPAELEARQAGSPEGEGGAEGDGTGR